MGILRIIPIGIVATTMCAPAVRCDEKPDADFATVQRLVRHLQAKEGYQKLVDLGSRAFDAYQVILADESVSAHELSRIFSVLARVEADRKPFLEHAVRSLVHTDRTVRLCAVNLVGKIGGPAETAPLVALLSDGHTVATHTIPYAAATALAAIGGPREVVAMEAWLLGGSHPDDKPLREHVKKCRDELTARLAKESKKK